MNNIPEGYKLAPVEPTDDMVIAFAEAWYSKRQAYDDPDMLDAYRDMLAAAPATPQPIFNEAKELEIFNTWYAKNIGVLGTSTWAEYIGVWMACAKSRAKAGEDE